MEVFKPEEEDSFCLTDDLGTSEAITSCSRKIQESEKLYKENKAKGFIRQTSKFIEWVSFFFSKVTPNIQRFFFVTSREKNRGYVWVWRLLQRKCHRFTLWKGRLVNIWTAADMALPFRTWRSSSDCFTRENNIESSSMWEFLNGHAPSVNRKDQKF